MTEPWRCPNSPSSAHHWYIDKDGLGRCKHCQEERQFDPGYKEFYADFRSKDNKVRAAKAAPPPRFTVQ